MPCRARFARASSSAGLWVSVETGCRTRTRHKKRRALGGGSGGPRGQSTGVSPLQPWHRLPTLYSTTQTSLTYATAPTSSTDRDMAASVHSAKHVRHAKVGRLPQAGLETASRNRHILCRRIIGEPAWTRLVFEATNICARSYASHAWPDSQR